MQRLSAAQLNFQASGQRGDGGRVEAVGGLQDDAGLPQRLPQVRGGGGEGECLALVVQRKRDGAAHLQRNGGLAEEGLVESCQLRVTSPLQVVVVEDMFMAEEAEQAVLIVVLLGNWEVQLVELAVVMVVMTLLVMVTAMALVETLVVFLLEVTNIAV